MNRIHEVVMAGQTVGTVELKREGLYYVVSCRCERLDHGIHRLYADGEKIGVLIPENGELVLNTKIAVKRLKPGCAFSLDEKPEFFVPIRPGETFAHLDRLRDGHLGFRMGEPGLMLK